MSAIAHVAHATWGRVRLRLPSERGDLPHLERIADGLRRCPVVTDVTVNARTGSVLVRHRGEFGAVAEHARAQDLFDVCEPACEPVQRNEGDTLTLGRLRTAILRANESLRSRTEGSLDLKTIGVAALLAGSIYQGAKGNFLPAGGTMLLQALDLVFGTPRQAE